MVERFSLDRAAAVQEEVYLAALDSAQQARTKAVAVDVARCGARILEYKVRRQWQRLRGTVATDDFNSVAEQRRAAARASGQRTANLREAGEAAPIRPGE